MNSLVVKNGYVGVKEEGLRSFLWSKKWLVLRENTLTFHKSDVIVTNIDINPSSCIAVFEGN